MTVAELIAKLEEMPQDATVHVIDTIDGYDLVEAQVVRKMEDSDVVIVE